MRISYTPEQDRLRDELRDYFARLMTPERREALAGDGGEYGDGKAYKEIVRELGRDGWLAIGWPEEWGGQARPMLDQLVFTDEAAVAGVPVPFLTVNTIGPTIMRFGTPEQKAFYLPRIAGGQLHFSIGYSEPEAGTDLASLRTRAVRDGDSYVVNGQKMWTSLIEYADYVWLAARTDPDAKRHKGLSILVMPTDAPGFSWTKVRTVAGPGTSATYYDDVRVPVSARIADENAGWPLITNQLNHERVALTSAAPIISALDEVRRWARETKQPDGSRVIDAEWVRMHLARVHAHAEYLKLRNWRIAWAAGSDELGAAAASATKVFGTELAIEAYRLLMEVVGPGAVVRAGSPGAVLRGQLERAHRSALILTFGGGTNEIQRDLIAATALSLPVTR
ncbi:acyl-CoA dehydrogenase family protein [Amycolatopsis methanolica]|uniref:Isovaleryl-CoA dehydrogenase n=1 Tax=Amycolatopsis methanolica 239 TaxID=1068978 RepID=A0A076N2N6_AMYME|nr:acyl-CoA dehydrogenase family protein [Amycolatopsis methanolica]AIJ25055.1 isovaleryl-CoA dehydrogenase [Amycolatopsis methanolica 239]